MSLRHPNVYSIPPGVQFLPTLVDAVLDGSLTGEPISADNPFGLADLTIYLPTRRAGRSLQQEFIRRAPSQTTLLPRIHTLGDLQENDTEFSLGSGMRQPQPEPVSSLHRRMKLSELLLQWIQNIGEDAQALYPDEGLTVPESVTDALWLAGDLTSLMDSLTLEEIDPAKLKSIATDEHAAWWKLTFEFLNVALEKWPDELAALDKSDPMVSRVEALNRQARLYLNQPPRGPVIAAGSTGSIPATARLLKTIAERDQGAVVLPGLDRDADGTVWSMLSGEREGPSTVSHPQFGLSRLLDHLGLDRASVHHIGPGLSSQQRQREQMVSRALLPAEATEQWAVAPSDSDEFDIGSGFDGVSLIEATTEAQEAQAIAVAIRDALEEPDVRIALITPDRVLARRVSAELRRFDIMVDDSAGVPLWRTPEGRFLRQLLSAAISPDDHINLASLLKNPLFIPEGHGPLAQDAVDAFELIVLRGQIERVGGQSFAGRLKRRRDQEQQSGHVPKAVARLSPTQWDEAEAIAIAIDDVVAAFQMPTLPGDEVALPHWAQQTSNLIDQTTAAQPGTNATNPTLHLIVEQLEELEISNTKVRCTAAEWVGTLEAAIGGDAVRSTIPTDGRVSVWGPLEARLQSVDVAVLGGLNEGTWPGTARNDPFLSRTMKREIGLDPPERRIGLSAHDFQMALGTAKVVLSRAKRIEHKPTIASRWLQRLLAVAGDKRAQVMHHRGQKYLQIAKHLDTAGPGKENPTPALTVRPAPRPPVEARPQSYSITEIETLIRDPYAVYARRVLDLAPLDALVRDADAREKGTLFHAILELYGKCGIPANEAQAIEWLKRAAREVFEQSTLPAATLAVWREGFDQMLPLFANWDAERSVNVQQSHFELSGSVEIGDNGTTLRGRADRIDRMKDGSIALIDFKTGSNPTKQQANSLLAPQLPLEGAMVMRGAFREIEPAPVSELAYVRLRPAATLGVDRLGKSDTENLNDFCSEAWASLTELMNAYREASTPFVSRARPLRQSAFNGDYDHLARAREWSTAPDGESE
ncbi:MAG: double-strand break repair protein AddB [Pseudomonadota bacterium]